jgi:predicted nucleic acid-binding protein
MRPPHPVVLDTNIVLDLFVFQDPQTQPLRHALHSPALRWIATPHMRNELQRVLAYPHLAAKLAASQGDAQAILSQFDACATLHTSPIAQAPYACKDADDQAFIDLACALAKPADGITPQSHAQRVSLISKDKAILSMHRRLSRLSVCVSPTGRDGYALQIPGTVTSHATNAEHKILGTAAICGTSHTAVWKMHIQWFFDRYVFISSSLSYSDGLRSR